MLVGRRNELLLSDFGLATIAQSAHSLGKADVAGTVTYMAPEQFRAKPTAASDQYALGIVLYEWLSGDYPFHGYAIETAIQHVLNQPVPLREKIPALAPTIEQVVMRALEKEPHKRFACMRDFASAFEQACLSATTETSVTSVTSETSETSSASRFSITAAQPLISLSRSDARSPAPGEEEYRTVALPAASRFTIPASAPIGTLLCIYRGHAAAVTALAWSPDGKLIASASDDKTVQVWFGP